MRWVAVVIIFGLCAGAQAKGPAKPTTAAERAVFLKMVEHLPHKGEFFTPEAVQKAAPQIAVLLALSEQDLKQKDLYPFLALSGQLCERREYRQYGVEHFSDIAHPEIRLSWAAILFDRQPPVSVEIVTYLRQALETEKEANLLSEIMGPEFAEFKKRVAQYKTPMKSR